MRIPFKRIVFEMRNPLLVLLVLGIISLLVVCKVFPSNLPWWIVYSSLIVLFYLFMIDSLVRHLKSTSETEEPLIICLFAFMTCLLVLAFGFCWYWFGVYGPPCQNERNGAISALYFAATGLTTLGFGDLVPLNDESKLFLIFEAVFGVTHMVAFFTVITGRLALHRNLPNGAQAQTKERRNSDEEV